MFLSSAVALIGTLLCNMLGGYVMMRIRGTCTLLRLKLCGTLQLALANQMQLGLNSTVLHGEPAVPTSRLVPQQKVRLLHKCSLCRAHHFFLDLVNSISDGGWHASNCFLAERQ
jgi:hypothetical protein